MDASDNANAEVFAFLPPLDDPNIQIRLLVLEPADFDDDISCTIFTCSLNSLPAFNAISYTWGPEEPQQELLIDGRPFRVRHNCHYAIQQARLHRPSDPIWIDSICIGQNNLAEKSAQVGIMGDIYCRASAVLACVGPSDEYSDMVQAAICKLEERLAQGIPKRFDDGTKSYWPWDYEDESWDIGCAMAEFSCRSYFERVWIVQELFGGRDRTMVLCGQSTLSWDRLTFLLGHLEIHSDTNGVNRMDVLIRQQGTFRPWSLCYILEHTTDLLCAEPRDRIFGVLKLIEHDPERCLIVPDYNLSPVQLAINLVLGGHFNTLDEILVLAKGMALSADEVAKFRGQVAGAHEKLHELSTFVRSAYFTESHKRRLHARSPLAEGDVSDDPDSSPEGYTVDQEHVKIFDEQGVVAPAHPSTKAGDLLLKTDLFHVVVRPQQQWRSFQVIGGALCFARTFWQDDYDNVHCPLMESNLLFVNKQVKDRTGWIDRTRLKSASRPPYSQPFCRRPHKAR